MITSEDLKQSLSHFVSTVAPNVKTSRYAITGWFS
jgi:Rps23 Pro-64 3,4-dihydroxylase Tpa1-like proline 4-hydroxylase